MDTSLPRVTADGAASVATGLVLVADNVDALAVRILAARAATRSLDLMYYLWHDDRTGRLLLKEVLDAAARGVRVRLLLDDIYTGHGNSAFAALAAHPNIQIRLFNPSFVRSLGFLKTVELVVRRFALTRRMHNKAWIVDGKLAIVGGRNIGDAYFNAADTNFRDLDMLLLGAAVPQTTAIFEEFWNFRAAKPFEEVNARPVARPGSVASKSVEDDEHLASVLHATPSVDDFIDRRRVHWTTTARIVSDPPQKVKGRRRRNWLTSELLPLITEARRSIEIVSPYFIPGREGMKIIAEVMRQGAEVAVLTNSLAATDVATVHGGYANYRKALLRQGVRLFELQPHDGRTNMSVLGSSGASLHTKAFTVDETHGFVGSLNFDPRSLSLNTEMGVIFEDERLVAELRSIFRNEIRPQSSYRVGLTGNSLLWTGVKDGVEHTFRREPEAGIGRRLLSALVRILPVESEL